MGQLFFRFPFPAGTIYIFQKSRKHGHFRIFGTKKSRIFFISAFNRSDYFLQPEHQKCGALRHMGFAYAAGDGDGDHSLYVSQVGLHEAAGTQGNANFALPDGGFVELALVYVFQG